MEDYQRKIVSLLPGDLTSGTLLQLHLEPEIDGPRCKSLIVFVTVKKDDETHSYTIISTRRENKIEKKFGGLFVIDSKCFFTEDVPVDYLKEMVPKESDNFLKQIEIDNLMKWLSDPPSQVGDSSDEDEKVPHRPPPLDKVFDYNNGINPSCGGFNLNVEVDLQSWTFLELIPLLRVNKCRILDNKMRYVIGFDRYSAIFEIDGKLAYVEFEDNNASCAGCHLSYIFKENPELDEYLTPLWEHYLSEKYPFTTKEGYFRLLEF